MVFNYKNKKINEEEYTEQYYKLMRNSYRNNKQKWIDVLNSNRYVFVCYCNSNSFCHRQLLTKILIKLGATFDGEIE